jgi:hypothetical protein
MAAKDEKARRKQVKDQYLRNEHAEHAAKMPLDRDQLQSLLAHVEDRVERDGCDHSRRATDAWAAANDLDLDQLHTGLEEYGGYCDCEVVMNVDPDLFEPVRQQRG